LPHKLRKIHKTRGGRTSARGRVSQHRKSGGRGGVGRAGGRDHFWSYTIKHEPLRYRKIGFNRIPGLVDDTVTVNVGQLSDIWMKTMNVARKPSVKKPLEIDLGELGFSKLLGRGGVDRAFVVKVSSWSEAASKKIEEAGGSISKP